MITERRSRCATQGETFEKLLKNLCEALEECLSVETGTGAR